MDNKYGIWMLGDSLTKVGCGILGGATVYLIANHNVSTYLWMVISAFIIMCIGYFIIGIQKNN